MDNLHMSAKMMQEKAIKYVNEMRAKSKFNKNNNYGKNDGSKKENNLRGDKYYETKQKGIDPISDVFDTIMQDSEKTLILVLILVLASENADKSVLFALIYLLM